MTQTAALPAAPPGPASRPYARGYQAPAALRPVLRAAHRTRLATTADVRQVGTVDEIRHTTDPVVRQFIEGRPSLNGNGVAAD